MVSDPFGVRGRAVAGAACKGDTIKGASWQGDKGNTIEGTRGQGDMGTRGRYREAKSYRGRDTGARRSRETKYRAKNSGWGGTVGNLSR